MKFLHTADWHLGIKYSSEYPEKLRVRLREDEKSLVLKILNLATESRITRILICGDLFDTHKPPKEIRDFVIEEFGKFDGRIYIVPGNHDFDGPESVYTVCQFPENVHIFGKEISKLEEEDVIIYGYGFSAPHKTDNTFEGFSAQKSDKPSVMLMHTDFAAESCYNPVRIQDIESCGLSYIAAGHIHKPDDISKRGNTYYAQSGSPRGLSFKENEAPGVYIINLEDGFLTAAREKVYCNRYSNFEIDVSEAESIEDIKKLCLDKIMAYEPAISLISIRLTGRLKQSVEFSLSELHGMLECVCLFLRISRDYSIAYDTELISRENSARGEFVRRVLRSFPDKDEEFILKVIEKGVELL